MSEGKSGSQALARAPQLGFWTGFGALFAAARQLLRLPGSWPYALVPGLVFVVLEVAFVVVGLELVRPWVMERLAGEGALRSFGAAAAGWISAALAATLGWLLSALLAPPISAPALERVVAIVERDLGAPGHAPLGFLGELWCGLRALLLSAAFTLPLLLGLTLLELIFPPVAVVTTPLKLLVGALGIAWGLFDYPLTLRGVGARERLSFMRRNASVVLGFGAAFGLAFWLPCCGILLLPVGVTAATRLLWQIQNAGGPRALRLR